MSTGLQLLLCIPVGIVTMLILWWLMTRGDRATYGRILDGLASGDPDAIRAAASVATSYANRNNPHTDQLPRRAPAESWSDSHCPGLYSLEVIGVSLLYPCWLDYGHEGPHRGA